MVARRKESRDEFARGHMPGAVLLPLEGQLTWPPEFEKSVAMLPRHEETRGNPALRLRAWR
jgi:hypothetical protein